MTTVCWSPAAEQVMTVLDDGLLLVLVQKTTCLLWEFNWGLVGLEIEDVGLRDWVV